MCDQRAQVLIVNVGYKYAATVYTISGRRIEPSQSLSISSYSLYQSQHVNELTKCAHQARSSHDLPGELCLLTNRATAPCCQRLCKRVKICIVSVDNDSLRSDKIAQAEHEQVPPAFRKALIVDARVYERVEQLTIIRPHDAFYRSRDAFYFMHGYHDSSNAMHSYCFACPA